MIYDYERRTAADRIWVENGKLIQVKNAVLQARALGIYDDFEVDVAAEWQLFEENGAPARGSFRGQGTIVDRGHEKYLIMGDLVRDATLTEYRIDKDMTRESEKRLDDTIEGIRAAIGDFKPGRRQKAKGEDWLRGYDEAVAHRKKVTPK